MFTTQKLKVSAQNVTTNDRFDTINAKCVVVHTKSTMTGKTTIYFRPVKSNSPRVYSMDLRHDHCIKIIRSKK